MRSYFIRRLIQLLPLLIGISFIIFLLLVLAPGNPVDMMIFGNPDVKPEDIVRLRKIYGLDDPIYIRYFKWLGNVLKGDLGYSQRWYRSNFELIKIHLPRTLILSTVSLFISLIIAIPIGVYSAVRQYSFVDYVVTFLAFVGRSMPTFWFGIMMILLFAVYLKWLPPGGMSTIGLEGNILDRAKYLIMPSIVLGLANTTGWMRYMRSSLLEVIRQDYIRTARAKGLPERTVIYKHALRNALIPIVTLIMLTIPGLFAGATITETVFNYPGMGLLLYEAIIGSDYSLAIACLLFLSLLTILFNFLADIVYVLIDPRIKYE